MQRLEEQNAKLLQQNRQLAQQTRQSSQQAVGGFGDQVRSLSTIALGYLSIDRAIGQVQLMQREHNEQITSLADRWKEVARNRSAAISSAGDWPNAGRVDQFVDAAAADRMTAQGAYSGVSGGAPAASLDRRFQLSEQALRASTLVENVESFGRLLGQISNSFEGLQAEDAADLALSLNQRAGANAGKLTSDSYLRSVKSLMASGAVSSPEEGFAYGLAAMDANLEPSFIERLSAAVGGSYKPRAVAYGTPSVGIDRAYNRFAHAGESDRLQMLLGDPTVAEAILGKEGAAQSRLLRRDRIDSYAQGLSSDIAGDFVGTMLDQQGATPSGRTALATKELKTIQDRQARDLEFQSARIKRALEFEEKGIERANPLGPNWAWKSDLEYFDHRDAPLKATQGYWVSDEERFRYLASETALLQSEGDTTGARQLARHSQATLRDWVQDEGAESVQETLNSIDKHLLELIQNLAPVDRNTEWSQGGGRSLPIVINAHTETR